MFWQTASIHSQQLTLQYDPSSTLPPDSHQSPHSGHIQSRSHSSLLLLLSPLSHRHVFAAIIDDFLPTFPSSDSITFRLDPAGAGRHRIGREAGQTGFVSHRTRAETRDRGSAEQGAGSGAAASVFARPGVTGGAVGVDQIRSGHRTALLAAESKGISWRKLSALFIS